MRGGEFMSNLINVSSTFTITKDDIQSIVRGVLVSVGGAVVYFLSNIIVPTITPDTDVKTVIALVVLQNIVNTARLFAKRTEYVAK